MMLFKKPLRVQVHAEWLPVAVAGVIEVAPQIFQHVVFVSVFLRAAVDHDTLFATNSSENV